MTNQLNAIDHRKALLAEGLRPSDYDQQAALDFINESIIPQVGYDKATTNGGIAAITRMFPLGWHKPLDNEIACLHPTADDFLDQRTGLDEHREMKGLDR